VAAIHVAGVRCDPCGAMQRIGQLRFGIFTESWNIVWTDIHSMYECYEEV
jgi:hypothetical protein